MNKVIEFIKNTRNVKQGVILIAVFAAAYLAGAGAGTVTTEPDAVETAADASENWGLGFSENGSKPTGNASPEELKDYHAAFIDPDGSEDNKVIYLTFDCGFENGNTEPILDALKKHNAPATFFIVGNYLETSPELVQRMLDEGHTVGNHTYHHPDITQISTEETFRKELEELETLFKETTGQEMTKFYRPPQGKYNEANLQMASDLGYCTFFWSLAYVDWYQDNQPTKEEAFSKLLPRIHPGAVVLLHNTSDTNGEILDELLTKWEEMGYHFENLEKLAKKL